VYCTDILKLLAGLISGALVDDVKYRLPGDIEDVDDNRVIKVDVVFEVELKPSK
jgi:hypothetical protein